MAAPALGPVGGRARDCRPVHPRDGLRVDGNVLRLARGTGKGTVTFSGIRRLAGTLQFFAGGG